MNQQMKSAAVKATASAFFMCIVSKKCFIFQNFYGNIILQIRLLKICMANTIVKEQNLCYKYIINTSDINRKHE